MLILRVQLSHFVTGSGRAVTEEGGRNQVTKNEAIALGLRHDCRPVQIIVSVEGTPEDYLAARQHSKMLRPMNCPNCGRSGSMLALGYYERCVSSLNGQDLRLSIRRFRCEACGRTASPLPHLAQPYRLIRNDAIERYFSGNFARADVQRCSGLLACYWRRFALEKAESECLADSERRTAQRDRERIRREVLDRRYVDEFAVQVRACFPQCPPGREHEIAEHACQKYSGRVGRSASAKSYDEQAVHLAVVAHIRHRETNYDELLARGWDRLDARQTVAAKVATVLIAWKG